VEPFFLAGTTGFLILFLLTLTSNDWSVRRAGFTAWKWIHRLVYLAAVALFYHQVTALKGNWGISLGLFIPVTTLEALRIGKVVLSAAGFTRQKHAWNGWRTFILDKRVIESETITSFYLKPRDRKPLRPFRPGQYLTVQVKIPDQPEPAIRTYTISDAPNEDYFRLSIKRDLEAGRPPGIVSNWFHDCFDVGDELLARAPTGQFYLENFDPASLIGAGAAVTPMIRALHGLIASRAYRQMKDARPVVLISAGVGITPMISMLNTLIADRFRGPVFFLHGTRNGSEHAFAGHVRSLARIHENIKVHVAYSRPRTGDLLGKDYDSHGRIGIEVIQAVVPNPHGDFFLCGPGAFMKAGYEGLAQWGVELERIHFEFFGPSTVAFGNASLPAGSKKHRIYFHPDDRSVAWDGVSTLLDCALSHGLKPRYGCRSGVCGTCACRLLNGKVSYLQTPVALTAKDTILLCSARPESDVTVALSAPLEPSRENETTEVRQVEFTTGINFRCFRPQS
jgi:ferredoxin-NADP reductase